MGSGNTQWEVFARAAEAQRVSPESLWGIYGTESGFGANLGPSSAGALGPMQFEPSTGAEYGLNSKTIMELVPSVNAAARLLKALGANTDPTSGRTIAALNAYNGNGGGESETSYSASVLKYGKQYGGTISPSGGGASEADGKQVPASNNETAGNIIEDITDSASLISAIMSGNVGGISEDFSLLFLSLTKDFAMGVYELIWAPVWHWNQRTVMWYGKEVLNPKEFGKKGKGQWAFLWTAAFWGVGYAILWVDPKTGGLRAAPVKSSRFHRHIRRVQSTPARRELIKPSKVDQHTPPKPPAKESRAQIVEVRAMATARSRAVTVTQTGGKNASNRVEDQQQKEQRVRIDKTGEVTISKPNRQERRHPKPNATDNPRKRPRQGGGGNPTRRAKGRGQ